MYTTMPHCLQRKLQSNIILDHAFHRMYRVSPRAGELRKEMDIN